MYTTLNNYYDLKFEKGLKDDEDLKIIRTSKIKPTSSNYTKQTVPNNLNLPNQFYQTEQIQSITKFVA